MVSLLRIKKAEGEIYEKVLKLYIEAFPREERRDADKFAQVLESKDNFYCNAVFDDDIFIGFFNYWSFENFDYGEHFAILPELRCKSYGVYILQNYVSRLNKNFLLEVELEQDELTCRRVAFYKRNGFVIFTDDYMQPDYRDSNDELRMLIMGRGDYEDKNKLNQDIETIRNKVYFEKSLVVVYKNMMFMSADAKQIDNTMTVDKVMDELYALVGLRKVKEEISKFCDYIDFVNLRKSNGFTDEKQSLNMIFTGHPGTGKNTVASLLAKVLNLKGVISNGDVLHCHAMDLVKSSPKEMQDLLLSIINSSKGNLLFIDEIGDLFDMENPSSNEMLCFNILINVLASNSFDDMLVIASDNTIEINQMFSAIPDLKKVFTRQLFFEDYSSEELMKIANIKLQQKQYRFSPLAEEKFAKLLTLAVRAKKIDFTNGRFIDERLDEAITRMSKRLMSKKSASYSKYDLMIIDEQDIVLEESADPSEFLSKLNDMFVSMSLKKNIAQHLNYVWFIKERQNQGLDDKFGPQNMIFSGNAGTGKMTIAKMFANYFSSLGIIESSKLVVQDARALNESTGLQAPQLASMLLQAAESSVLYISNAEAFMQSEFSANVLENLRMMIPLDEPSDFIIILSGLPEYMDKLLSEFPNYKLAFPSYFKFADYSCEELCELAEKKFKFQKYNLDADAKLVMNNLISQIYANKTRQTSNTALIGKLVDRTIHNMSDRLMILRSQKQLNKEELTTIYKEDIPKEMFADFVSLNAFDEKAIEEALKELDDFVGQDKIKSQIKDFVRIAGHYNSEGIKISSKMSLQWSFLGHQGVGKSLIASIIAKLYKAMGITSNDNVVEFKVEKLLGLTEEAALHSIADVISKASGGILLYDEDSDKLSKSGVYKEKVKAVVMSSIAENPGTCIVFFNEPLSYVSKDANDIEHSSELMNILVFEDYSKEELMLIMTKLLSKEKMRLTSSAKQQVMTFIDLIFKTDERRTSGARLIKVAKDIMVMACLKRIIKENENKDRSKGKSTNTAVKTMNKNSMTFSISKKEADLLDEKLILVLVNEKKRIGFVS